MTDRLPGFNTLAIHAGAAPDAATGARATPIYQTTSFVFDDVDHAASLFGLQAFGNIYTRITNPTNAVLEERIAALEGGTAALAVASGHAAEFLTMHALMQPGDEFVAADRLYGGSINQFNHSYKNFGWNVVWAQTDDPSSFERAITERERNRQTLETTFVSIDKAEIVAVEVRNRVAQVTVRFLSNLITATRNAEGKVVDGSAETVVEVPDVWTFARTLGSRDPNWQLVATEAGA